MSVLKLGKKINKMEGSVGRGKCEGLFGPKKIRGANEIFDKRVFAHLPLILIFIYIFAKFSNKINVHSIFFLLGKGPTKGNHLHIKFD